VLLPRIHPASAAIRIVDRCTRRLPKYRIVSSDRRSWSVYITRLIEIEYRVHPPSSKLLKPRPLLPPPLLLCRNTCQRTLKFTLSNRWRTTIFIQQYHRTSTAAIGPTTMTEQPSGAVSCRKEPAKVFEGIVKQVRCFAIDTWT